MVTNKISLACYFLLGAIMLIAAIFLASCEQERPVINNPVCPQVGEVTDPYPTGGLSGIEIIPGDTIIFQIDPDLSGPRLNFWRWQDVYDKSTVILDLEIDGGGLVRNVSPVWVWPDDAAYDYLESRIRQWHFEGRCYVGKLRLEFIAGAGNVNVKVDHHQLSEVTKYINCPKKFGNLTNVRVNRNNQPRIDQEGTISIPQF